MFSTVLVRPQARLICRSRILAALKSSTSRPYPLDANIMRKTIRGQKSAHAIARPQVVQGPDVTKYIPRSGNDILRYLDSFERTLKEGYIETKVEHPMVFRFVCFCGVYTVICIGVYMSIPLLFAWPPVLKEDIKAATSAIRLNDHKAAVLHMSKAWLKTKSIPPDVLSPDPNLKILKVASTLAVSLCNDGQQLEAFRLLSEALSLRNERISEQLSTASRSFGTRTNQGHQGQPGQAISISKDERTLVIVICLWLSDIAKFASNSAYERYYTAYAFAEAVRLSRARSSTNWKYTYKPKTDKESEVVNNVIPIDPRSLMALGLPSRFELQSDPAFRGIFGSNEGEGEGGELCHTSPWWQDYLYPSVNQESDWSCMMLATERMGEYCKKSGQPLLAIENFLTAFSIISKTIKKAEDASHFLRLTNKVFRSILDFHSLQHMPQTEKAKLPTPQDCVNNLDALRPALDVAELRTGSNIFDASEMALFHVIHGRAYLMSGQPENAARKFERGLKLAKAYGTKDVENLASEGLGISQSHVINELKTKRDQRDERGEGTPPEGDKAALLLRL